MEHLNNITDIFETLGAIVFFSMLTLLLTEFYSYIKDKRNKK